MKDVPSMDQWLREAKEEDDAGMCGMYLVHNGTVRQTAKAMVREGEEGLTDVIGMNFSFDSDLSERRHLLCQGMAERRQTQHGRRYHVRHDRRRHPPARGGCSAVPRRQDQKRMRY